MDIQIVLYVIAGVLILVGLAGVVLPVLPGLPLMFAGMVLAAWADDFKRVPIWVIAILGLMSLAAVAIDFLATSLGAKRFGASKQAITGAALGTFGGLFFGIPGVIVGPFAGAVVGELIHGRELAHASKIGLATWLGLIFGTALKIAMSFAMLAIFALALII
jgi:uncharacterized protein YqgC (DUF456 family)